MEQLKVLVGSGKRLLLRGQKFSVGSNQPRFFLNAGAESLADRGKGFSAAFLLLPFLLEVSLFAPHVGKAKECFWIFFFYLFLFESLSYCLGCQSGCVLLTSFGADSFLAFCSHFSSSSLFFLGKGLVQMRKRRDALRIIGRQN